MKKIVIWIWAIVTLIAMRLLGLSIEKVEETGSQPTWLKMGE